MARSGQEIQEALRAFATKWRAYAGSEKAEAQTFLNELFTCYGTDRQGAGARFEDFRSSAGFMDLHWPGTCIVEMKKPAKDLTAAREQVKRYWEESSDPEADIPAARWVVVCSFQRFEVWEPGRFPGKARVTIDLDDLPDHYDVLNFLAGPNVEPVFAEHHRRMTTQAAEKVALAYQALIDRSAAPAGDIQRFVLQSVWCMFAEDLGMLADWPFQRTIQLLIREPDRSSAQELGYLFRLLNQKTDRNRRGVFAGTTYVNGDLFADPAEVHLDQYELDLMLAATEFDWRKVDPTIFGSLMEGVLGERRWELGAHYTHEVDIMKIVTPTIVRPWQERIDAVATPDAGVALLEELCAFKVLDPACGCGNFLYVAYRELRALEHQLKVKIVDVARATGLARPPGPLPFVPLTNMQGIDIERTAVMIARITLWMGHRQVIDVYGAAEDPLPLVTLSSVQVGDALRIPWPETDCIVGNPPFLGASLMRSTFGDDYLAWLKREFKVGIKDFCVYWFRRTSDHLRPGQRAGLVGTNSISQNLGRSASLQYIVDQGGVVTDAVSSQKWPGEAKVHVSLVNWIDDPIDPAKPFTIDGIEANGIGPDLRDASPDAWTPQPLASNKGKCFEGPSPKAKGFLIGNDEAAALMTREDAPYSDVVRRYLTAADIATAPEQQPTRWAVDFGTLTLEKAHKYQAALAIIREPVMEARSKPSQKSYLPTWWQFARPRAAMRAAIHELPRYAVGPRHSKRCLLVWSEKAVLASDATNVFAFEDDFSMAVLQSRAHVAWAWQQSSTLKGDLRYTPTSVFMTFPWPDTATAAQREATAETCRRLLARRSDLCIEHDVGLTKLYNAMDDGAYTDLKKLHLELDQAIVDCYGWPKSIAQDDKELVRRLTDLNRQIVEGEKDYAPFAYLDE